MAVEKKDGDKKIKKHPLLYGFSVFILLVIAISFIGAPVVTQFGGQDGAHVVFGTYNGRDISFTPGNYFSRQKDAIADRVSDSGTNVNIEWVAYQVWLQAFENTAIHTALLEKAAQSGLDISSDKIDRSIAMYGPYIRDGKFDPELYRRTSDRDKTEHRRLFREELIDDQVRTDILHGQLISSREKAFIQEMGRTRRSFRILPVTMSSYPDSEAIAFGMEHPELFRQASFARITIQSSRAAAENVLDRVSQAPATFEEVARTQSRDAFAERGGLIGNQFFYRFRDEFENTDTAEAVFALGRNEISDIMETPFGFIIYKCIEPARDADWQDPDSIDVVQAYLEQYERGRIEDYLLDFAAQIRTVAVQDSIDKAAANFGLSYFDVEDIGINFGNSQLFPEVPVDKHPVMRDVADNEEFFTALFALEDGAISRPVLLRDSVIIALALNTSEAEDNELQIIEHMYPWIIQRYQSADLRRSILESDRLVDRFDERFRQFFLN